MLVETAVEAARRFGDRPAFVTDEGLSLGYAEFDRICDETAMGMAELGVAQGDVVALALPPWPSPPSSRISADQGRCPLRSRRTPTDPLPSSLRRAPRAHRKEEGVAVIVPRQGAPAPALSDLRSFAGSRLARYKLRDDLVIVTELPWTAGEKVDRRALERMIARP